MSYIDKPRFHKPTHPARIKPAPAEPHLEPQATRLPLLRSENVPANAPPLQAHAQAGLDMQRQAMADQKELQRQQAAQIQILADAKEQLRKELPLRGIRCAATDCSALAKHDDVQAHVFRSRRSKHICPDPRGDPSMRVLQLGIEQTQEVPAAVLRAMEQYGGELLMHPVVFDWDYWSVDQILRALLPDELEEGAPSAFSMVGHIAHVNLREEYLAYRYLIGQVILDKTPRVETVVNKLDTIDTEFRVFAMELLAGIPKYTADVSESGCLFTLDFRHVYWNSRLHTEHGRIIDLFEPFQVVADVMAGVGPFAVPAAKKGCWVLANDLNPACYESLMHNIRQNKVMSHCLPSCDDGRKFIRHSIRQAWEAAFPANDPSLMSGRQKRRERRIAANGGGPTANAVEEHAGSKPPVSSPGLAALDSRPRRLIDHFVMNLPASALEFLDAFRGAYAELAQAVGADALDAEIAVRQAAPQLHAWPMVHVHCFTKDVEHAGDDICARASAALGLEGNACLQPPGSPHATPDLSLHLVRSVAPNKDMYCLSFRLTPDVLYKTTTC